MSWWLYVLVPSPTPERPKRMMWKRIDDAQHPIDERHVAAKILLALRQKHRCSVRAENEHGDSILSTDRYEVQVTALEVDFLPRGTRAFRAKARAWFGGMVQA